MRCPDGRGGCWRVASCAPPPPCRAHAGAERNLYQSANRDGIRNPLRASLIGSGAIEKQVEVVLCRRLKTRGMSWHRPGAPTLQRLRGLKLHGDKDRDRKRRRLDQARQMA